MTSTSARGCTLSLKSELGGDLFSAVKPTGCRCTCNIGATTIDSSKANAWNFKIEELHNEMSTFKSNALDPALSESEHADAFARLKRLIVKAKQGQLVFSGTAPEAKVMERADYVIELRPQPEVQFRFGQPQRPARLVRLYCAEPQLLDQTILGLHLGTKPNGEDVAGEQNASIDCAADRANAWEMREHRSKLDTKTEWGATKL